MKNTKRTLLPFLTIIIMIASLFSGTVSAGTYNRFDKAVDINLGVKASDATTDACNENFYKFTLPASGELSIDLSTKRWNTKVEIFNDTYDEVWESREIWCWNENPATMDEQIQLLKGTYYMRVSYGSQKSNGAYSFTLTFKSANETFSEGPYVGCNNSYSTASSINLDTTYYGQIIRDIDNEDYYTFTLSSSEDVTLNIDSYMNCLTAVIYDSNYNKVWDKGYVGLHREEGTDKAAYNQTISLASGTYYLKITYGCHYSSGFYNFQLTSSPKVEGWVNNNGQWYYYSNNVAKTGWVNVYGDWYYLDTNGVMKTGWFQAGNVWYYANKSGVMQKGWMQLGGNWYYLGTDGAMRKGWFQVGSAWYYANKDGVMQTGWQQIGGNWYYLNASGAMVTGWQQIFRDWYYFSSDGTMRTGWVQIGGNWYYLGSNGAMTTGWEAIGNKWYYFFSSGVMATGTQTINGTTYRFSSNGEWIK